MGPRTPVVARATGGLQQQVVDIDANPNIPVKFGIRGIPTVILFKDGEQLDMFVGNSPQKVREMVERAV